ncbi:hypothetical protein AB0A05_27280 [Streptomyces sp. NPDC046374]|uniref:hypothetical protein n=1 Tax=Streptomyces sp. NPDC046374 TaxID=3154917 RepID=UPI0033E8A310
MRATIRRTNPDAMHEDAVAAIAQLRIDPGAAYVGEMVTVEPGQPEGRIEVKETGEGLEAYLLAALQTGFHEVEQTDPEVIVLRWTRKSKRNNYRTRELVLRVKDSGQPVMREQLTRAELLKAVEAGARIEAHPRTTPYAGEEVEYLPRVDSANGHPDAYPWRVKGRQEFNRLRNAEVVAF